MKIKYSCPIKYQFIELNYDILFTYRLNENFKPNTSFLLTGDQLDEFNAYYKKLISRENY